MMNIEDIRAYLPKYLSETSTTNLFNELSQFPDNIDSRMYCAQSFYSDEILQGDGLQNLLVVNLPDSRIEKGNCLVMTNSCDNDMLNERLYPTCICYCPIFSLEKFKFKLKQSYSEEPVEQFVRSIKKQKISQVFYLPKGSNLNCDSFVFLDRVCNCDNSFVDRIELGKKKLFTLSNYGFYMFLFKLSIHFTRIREGIDRAA